MHNATDKSWYLLSTYTFQVLDEMLPNLITLSLTVNISIIYIRKHSCKVYCIQGPHIDFIPWLLALRVLASKYYTSNTRYITLALINLFTNILVRTIKEIMNHWNVIEISQIFQYLKICPYWDSCSINRNFHIQYQTTK